jgi:hypothetical protein
MKGLTDRQLEAVALIYEGQKVGNTPTLVELAEKLGVSSRQTVKDILDAVAKKGYLVRKARRPRAIMLKPEAIGEIEKRDGYLRNIQRKLGLEFAQSTDAYQWHNHTNIVIDRGAVLNKAEQILVDSSHSIFISDKNGDVAEEPTQVQFVAEKSNFDQLNNSASEFLIEAYQPLVIRPVVPNIGSETGYLVVEGDSQYQVVWSGVGSGHYYCLGKEYGQTTDISIVDGENGQIKLFSQSMNEIEVAGTLSDFRKALRSWSHYVDFPIYGAALKKTGEVIFWSRKTARDINDLRHIFVIDITGTGIISRDKVLLRDVFYNFPNLINNSIQ